MSEVSTITRTRDESIALIEPPPRAPLPALVRHGLVDRARRQWHEGLAAGEGALVALRPVLRDGLHAAAWGAAGLVRSSREGIATAMASARLAASKAPGRLREGLGRAIDAAGFGPLRALLLRYPDLAAALGIPVLIASLFLVFWSGVSAAILGLWCVTISLVFANQAARRPTQDDADPTKLLTKETFT